MQVTVWSMPSYFKMWRTGQCDPRNMHIFQRLAWRVLNHHPKELFILLKKSLRSCVYRDHSHCQPKPWIFGQTTQYTSRTWTRRSRKKTCGNLSTSSCPNLARSSTSLLSKPWRCVVKHLSSLRRSGESLSYSRLNNSTFPEWCLIFDAF